MQIMEAVFNNVIDQIKEKYPPEFYEIDTFYGSRMPYINIIFDISHQLFIYEDEVKYSEIVSNHIHFYTLKRIECNTRSDEYVEAISEYIEEKFPPPAVKSAIKN